MFIDGEAALLLAMLTPSERDESGRYSTQARNPWLAPLVQLATETVMRQGELLALKWENVRLVDRVAHLPMTKNGSNRTVPLSTRAVEILKSLPRSLKGQVIPVSSNAVKLGFSRAVKRARKLYESNGGTDDRMLCNLHFHDLRHVAITRLAEKLAFQPVRVTVSILHSVQCLWWLRQLPQTPLMTHPITVMATPRPPVAIPVAKAGSGADRTG